MRLFERIKPIALTAPLLAAALLLFAASAHAGPASVKRGGETSKSKKPIEVWKVKQSNAWGTYTIYSSRQFFKVTSTVGGSLIAKAPDWKVHVFNDEDKRICSIGFNQFQKHSTQASISVEQIGAKPNSCVIAGIKGNRYAFPPEQKQQLDNEGLFRSGPKVEILRVNYSVAADNHGLPKEVIEVWRLFFDLPTRNLIPLEIRDDVRFGGFRYRLKTESQAMETVDAKFFDVPVGYKPKEGVIATFFGSSMEDACQLMLDMK